MKTGILTALVFLAIFIIGIINGIGVNWQSWFWGFAAGISAFKLLLPIIKKE